MECCCHVWAHEQYLDLLERFQRQVCYCTKKKFSVTNFFSKCDQIRSFQRIWPHLLKKSVTVNFMFYAVCKAAGPVLADSLAPLVYCHDVVSFAVFYRLHFGKCSVELDVSVPFPLCCSHSTRYTDRQDDFAVSISRSFLRSLCQ